MTRTAVNRVVLLVLGLALLVAGVAAVWTGSGLAMGTLPPLLSPGELWSPVRRLAEDPATWSVVGLVAGLVLLLAGLAMLEGQLRPGRRRRRRRAELDLSPDARDATVVRGSALSGAVAADLTRIHEVQSASVVTWEDERSTRLEAVIGLSRGRRVEDVHAGIQGALARAEQALGGRTLDAAVRLDILDAPQPRVR